MLAYIMDFDPRITSDGHGWHCNFHFGHGHDVIEDAKNEKFCVQALQYLIAKADAEIRDLEDELAIHQCQLKWAEADENKNPYEDCCATFKKKIDLLTKSIKNARNRSSLDEHDTDTSVRIQRPAERICDIISALVKHKFSAPDEQVEDLSNGMPPITSGSVDNGTDLKQTETAPESAESKELITDVESLYKVEDLFNGMPPITSGSVDNGTDLKQTETTPESAESKELMTDVESQYKHVDTVSEESCSDTVKYAIRDSVEARDVSKIVVKGNGKIEVDAYECTPEAISGFIGDSKVYNNSGEESEECMTGSKFSGSGSSSLFAKAKVAVKVEEDNYDTSIQHSAADSGCKMQDHVSGYPVEAHQVIEGNHSPSADNIEITYERKKPGLCSFRKPQKQKLQRKHPSAAGQLTLNQMQKKLGKIGKGIKRQFPPNLDDPQSNSPSSEAENFSSLPESVGHTVNIAHGIHHGILGSKKRKLLKACREDASIQSQEVELSKDEDICASEDLATESKSELVMCLQSPSFVEGKDSNLANLHNGSKKNAEDANMKVSPAYDLEVLKLKLSVEPDFINKMKAPDLKEILKSQKVRGFSKFKKEKMIEEVNKLLKAT